MDGFNFSLNYIQSLVKLSRSCATNTRKQKKTIIRKFKYQNNWVRECARDYRIRRKKKHFKFRILPSEKST